MTKASLSRRESLIGLGAAGALMAAPIARAETSGLAQLARAKGIRFGTAIGIKSVRDRTGAFYNPGIQALMERECAVLVPENELKMYVTHNQPGAYNFEPADEILKFALNNGIALRGHTLVWARDEYTPQWLKSYDFGPVPAIEAEKLMRDYIETILGHYGDKLVSWDVVNEAINPQTGHIRASAFTRAMGPEALKLAYTITREHLPKTELVYNDYMSWETGNEAHRQGVLDLLKWFRKNNVPVDALGVQSHIGTGFDLSAGQHSAWKTFLDEITGMGYRLLITEFDVNDQRVPGTIAERDAKVAKVARDYLDMLLSYPQVTDFLLWGLDDGHSWLQEFSPRADKQPLRPCPFDADLKPKPLYDAIASALKTAPERKL